jgi:cytochrome c oxidase subunit 2
VRLSLRQALPAAVLVVLLVAGCGSQQNALAPHSKAARSIDSLWWNMLIGAALGFGVVVLILGAAWVRRNRPGFPGVRDGDRAALVVVLTLGLAVPVVVLSALFLFSDIFLIRDTSVPAANASPAEQPKLTIRVIGHQFWWEVRYPGTRAITANEIHIPVRTPVQVLVYTDDVIHSFWVPELNRKIDMIPDQTNRVMLYADKVGRYRGQCAEFCGLQHAHMGFYVFADTRAQFGAWLTRESLPAKNVSSLFQSECAACHAIRGTPATSHVGPDLTHIGSRTSLAALTIPNTPAHLAQWLRDPQSIKPGSQMPALGLTSRQIAQLVVYLEKLR